MQSRICAWHATRFCIILNTMKHILLYIIGAVVILIVGFYALNNFIYSEKQGDSAGQPSYKDIAYVIEGEEVQLIDGNAQTAAATGTAQIVTTFAGNEAEGDLNEDGISDVAFLLTQDRGGSGTFYYVVAALKTDTGYQGTSAGFIGDRIDIESVESEGGIIRVNFLRPETGASTSTENARSVFKQFVVVNNELVSYTN